MTLVSTEGFLVCSLFHCLISCFSCVGIFHTCCCQLPSFLFMTTSAIHCLLVNSTRGRGRGKEEKITQIFLLPGSFCEELELCGHSTFGFLETMLFFSLLLGSHVQIVYLVCNHPDGQFTIHFHRYLLSTHYVLGTVIT